MNQLDITVLYMDEEFDISLDSGMCNKVTVLTYLKETKQERFEQESGEDVDAELDDEFDVIDWKGVPPNLQDWDILDKLMGYYETSSLDDIKVWAAAHSCGIDFSNVEEAYQGSYKDDEDFAYETACQIGAINDKVNWPYTCIDWRHAARELMNDYCGDNGYYFRNF